MDSSKRGLKTLYRDPHAALEELCCSICDYCALERLSVFKWGSVFTLGVPGAFRAIVDTFAVSFSRTLQNAVRMQDQCHLGSTTVPFVLSDYAVTLRSLIGQAAGTTQMLPTYH
jgi:hypothetical protein